MKKGIWYYFKTGFKLSLILLLSQLVLFIPNWILQGKLTSSLTDIATGVSFDSLILYLVFAVFLGIIGLILNGYFVYKWEKWIFK